MKNKKIAIIGAGVAGLNAGIMLEELGYDFTIFEASDKIRGSGSGLTLASNAINAFERLGLADEVIKAGNVLNDFDICDAKGKTLFKLNIERIKQNFNADNIAFHRADLHKVLFDKINQNKVCTGKKLNTLKSKNSGVELHFTSGEIRTFDFVLGADGLNSSVRQYLLPKSKPRYAGYWSWRGVVHLNQENRHKSREIWSKKGRFGYAALTQNRYYWFACINTDLKDDIQHFQLRDLQKRFRGYFKFARELLALSKNEEVISMPIMDIEPIDQFYFKNILLLGDAAHATTPNMGQGACMAIEDIAVLQDELKQSELEQACKNFEKRRLSRTRYIIENSRRAGKIAQLEPAFLNLIRDNLCRILPDHLIQMPLKRLYKEDFMQS